jgi:hypothetical protein
VTEVYEVAGRRLGVRWSRPGLDAELRSLAAGAIGVRDAPANLSIVVGESAGRTRSKHQLHTQAQLSSMISSDGGLIRAVIRALGGLAGEPPPGSLSLSAFLVVEPGGIAVAIDRRLAADLRRLGPVIRRLGRRVLQLPRLDVWPDRGTAVLPDAATAVGVSVEALDARWPLERGDDDLAAGDVAIARLVYAGLTAPESRGHAVADMLPMLRDPTGRVDRTEVAQLAALTANLPVAGVVMQDHGRLAAVLALS